MSGVFERAFGHVIGVEGGYVNDPADPGGETKFGISARAYPGRDIGNLTIETAREIYRRDYWDRCRCDGLPPMLAVAVFDCAVNQGCRPAGRFLQRALGVTADGAIGPVTLRAAHSADAGAVLVDFMARRAVRYAATAGFDRFGRGWYRRLFLICLAASLED